MFSTTFFYCIFEECLIVLCSEFLERFVDDYLDQFRRKQKSSFFPRIFSVVIQTSFFKIKYIKKISHEVRHYLQTQNRIHEYGLKRQTP